MCDVRSLVTSRSTIIAFSTALLPKPHQQEHSLNRTHSRRCIQGLRHTPHRELQRAARLSAALSEAGTPRVSSRERHVPPELRAFSLSFQGCPLASIELHTPANSPLQPGMTFSGTIDFRTPDTASSKRAVCRQVLLLLSSSPR